MSESKMKKQLAAQMAEANKKEKLQQEMMRAVMQKRNSIAESVILSSINGRVITDADKENLVADAIAIADQLVAKTLAVKVHVEPIPTEQAAQ